METAESLPAKAPASGHPWLLFLAGIVLFLLGPAAYYLRFNARHLETPWYMLMLSTLGVALMVASVVKRRGWARIVLLIPFALVCGFLWFVIGVGSKSPEYRGPAQAGKSIPPFATKLADATAFTDKDLSSGTTTALVFYRGHW